MSYGEPLGDIGVSQGPVAHIITAEQKVVSLCSLFQYGAPMAGVGRSQWPVMQNFYLVLSFPYGEPSQEAVVLVIADDQVYCAFYCLLAVKGLGLMACVKTFASWSCRHMIEAARRVFVVSRGGFVQGCKYIRCADKPFEILLRE